MLNLSSVMIGSHQPKELIKFYEMVLGKKPDMGEGDWAGWKMGELYLNIGPHSEIKGNSKEPQRIIFNLETEEVKKEFDRIKKAGAVVIKEPYQMNMQGEEIKSNGKVDDGATGMWIATLADPDGNYFQLMTPWSG